MIHLKVKETSFFSFLCNQRHASCRRSQFTLGGKAFKTTAAQGIQTELHQLHVKGYHKYFFLTHELQCLSTNRLLSALRECLFLRAQEHGKIGLI